jgi:hypothetical protein
MAVIFALACRARLSRRQDHLPSGHADESPGTLETLMKLRFLPKLALAAAVMLAFASTAMAGPKNWSAPAYKMYAQQLSDEIMASHPELISVTFHGVPPGLDKVYTMYAGSFPERIGNADDPDDIEVVTKAITIVDPRWNRTKDTVKKFVMMMPLRDAKGQHIGLLVLAYKNPPELKKTETDFWLAATALRDDLQAKIPSNEALFKPVAGKS